VAERADLMKGKLFDAVAHLKTGPAEFDHPLDQRLKNVLLRLLGRVVYVNMKPFHEAPF
jgi:hypothetical protein